MLFLPSQEGTATSSWANPSWASPRPTAAPSPRRPKESHTTSAGSRKESDEPGT